MTTRPPGVEENAPQPPLEGAPGRDTNAGERPVRAAKPTAGEVDIRALHEEIAAEFPKTIARLAE